MKDGSHEMNLDQQIKSIEENITLLEECRRNCEGDPTRFDEDLDEAYRQVALLKIRKMMDMKA
jgi:hypothetical protein